MDWQSRVTLGPELVFLASGEAAAEAEAHTVNEARNVSAVSMSGLTRAQKDGD